MNPLDAFLLVALPYIAIAVFIVGSVLRYRTAGFKVSSLSSQFLEGKRLFWGSVPFHWGLVVLFLAHLAAFLIPGTVLAWNGDPVRLLAAEITGFAFGLSVLVGLILLFVRRLTNPRVRAVTTHMDLALELLLLGQVVLGLVVAVHLRWGSTWFASNLSPYLWSLLRFSPDAAAVAAMPLLIQLHVTGAFVLLLILPFTRLIHVLVVPIDYLWRPWQRVIWSWDRKKIRDPASPWTPTPPRNN